MLERKPSLGGPAAKLEFMPGYFTTFANSPGSFEPKIAQDLELERHGLEFVRPDPTLVHPLEATGSMSAGAIARATRPSSRPMRRAKRPATTRSSNTCRASPTSWAYRLQPPPTLQELVRNLTRLEDQEAFSRILFGNMRDLMDEFELAPETQALIAPLAVVGGQVAPWTPGTPFNLMMRPLSLASVRRRRRRSAADPAARLDRASRRRHGRDHRGAVRELHAHGGEVKTGKPVAVDPQPTARCAAS